MINNIIKYIERTTSEKVIILTEDGEAYCANPSTVEEISNNILKEITESKVR